MPKKRSEDQQKTTVHYYETCRVEIPKKKKSLYYFGQLLSVTAEGLATVLTTGNRIIQVDKHNIRLKSGSIR